MRRMSAKSEVMQIACLLANFYEAAPMTALFDKIKSGARRGQCALYTGLFIWSGKNFCKKCF